MKKMMFAAVMALACAAQADFTWSNWWGAPDLSNEAKRGCVLGFASDVDTVTGAQVSAIMSRAKKVTCGCQFAIGYSNVGSLRNGCQLAVGGEDSAPCIVGVGGFYLAALVVDLHNVALRVEDVVVGAVARQACVPVPPHGEGFAAFVIEEVQAADKCAGGLVRHKLPHNLAVLRHILVLLIACDFCGANAFVRTQQFLHGIATACSASLAMTNRRVTSVSLRGRTAPVTI